MFKKSVFGKVLGLVLLISITISLVISVVLIRQNIQFFEMVLVNEIKTLAENLIATIEAGQAIDVFPLKVLKNVADDERIVFLWIVDPDGRIYYADDPGVWGKQIKDIFLGTLETKVRDSFEPRTGEKIKIFASPLRMEVLEKELWTLFLGVSKKEIIATQKMAVVSVFSLLLVFVLLFGAISFYLTKGIVRPIEELRKGIEIFREGDFNYRVEVKTGDEIEELANSFNQMAENLSQSYAALEEAKTVLEIKVKARTRELKELTEGLDEQVKERTKELQERVAELERFQKLVVGRELKMIELKKEIKKLKKKLEEMKNKS